MFYLTNVCITFKTLFNVKLVGSNIYFYIHTYYIIYVKQKMRYKQSIALPAALTRITFDVSSQNQIKNYLESADALSSPLVSSLCSQI